MIGSDGSEQRPLLGGGTSATPRAFPIGVVGGADLGIGSGVLYHGHHPRGHESPGTYRTSGARHLGDFDDAAAGGHLDASAGARRRDLERLSASADVDDDLHAVSLHAAAMVRVAGGTGSRASGVRRPSGGPGVPGSQS